MQATSLARALGREVWSLGLAVDPKRSRAHSGTIPLEVLRRV